MNIPLIDLKAQYKSISEDLDRVTKEVLSSAAYIMGKNVTEFEKEFAEYIGVKHAISVGNGTDALVIALKSLGIGEGDEVITSTFTYFASAECISAVGATPVFVDVEKDTFTAEKSSAFSNLINYNATPTTVFIKNGEELSKATRINGNVSEQKIINKFKSNDFIK